MRSIWRCLMLRQPIDGVFWKLVYKQYNIDYYGILVILNVYLFIFGKRKIGTKHMSQEGQRERKQES